MTPMAIDGTGESGEGASGEGGEPLSPIPIHVVESGENEGASPSQLQVPQSAGRVESREDKVKRMVAVVNFVVAVVVALCYLYCLSLPFQFQELMSKGWDDNEEDNVTMIWSLLLLIFFYSFRIVNEIQNANALPLFPYLRLPR